MDLVGVVLPCAEVSTLALAPFWALAMVWASPLRRGERFAAGLGLCLGFCMMWTLPLHALAVMLGREITGWWLAPVFGVASIILGSRVNAVHRRRAEGEDAGDPRLGAACLILGAGVALVLAPTVTRVEGSYVTDAGVVALVMATQAWLLLPPNLITRAGACAALLGVVAAAPLLMK